MVVLKLKASSLLEAIISMVVISIVFSIGMMTIGSVTNHIQSVNLVKANIILNEISLRSIPPAYDKKETIQVKEFTIEKEWLKYSSGFIRLSLRAYDKSGRLITKKNELFNIP